MFTWFPRPLENLEKWQYTFQSRKSHEILPKILEKSGNFTENTGKVRKF